MPAKTILITGEQGFVGSRLMLKLKSHGYSVYGLDGDVTDKLHCVNKMMEVRPEVVFHLAALSLPKQCDENPLLARAVNIDGTKNIVDSANSIGIPIHLVFASTVQVYDYDELSKGLPINEDCAIRPQNLYAETKLEAEKMLYSGQYKNLKITILRLFNHVHKSQQSATFMSSLYSQILAIKRVGNKDGDVTTGDLELYREFNPVQNLLNLFLKLSEGTPDYQCEAFNVCSGKTYRLRDVAEAFGRVFDVNLNFILDPRLIRKNDPKIVVGSNKKLKDKWNCPYPELSESQLVEYFCSDI